MIIDLYNDSSIVTCSFEMMNHDEDITLEIGFPEMNFDTETFSEILSMPKGSTSTDQWEEWRDQHLNILKINVNGNPLGHKYIQFLKSEQTSEPFAWYVWEEQFKSGVRKNITVSYTMPYGRYYTGFKHIGANVFRVFRYLLSTGAGWYQSIGTIDLEIRFHDIPLQKIESVAPIGYLIDEKNKKLHWSYVNIEPSTSHDVLVLYYDPQERKEVDEYFEIPAPSTITYRDGKWYKERIRIKDQ